MIIEKECVICRKKEMEVLKFPETKFFTTGADEIFSKGEKDIKRGICKSCGSIQFISSPDYIKSMQYMFSHFNHRRQKVFNIKSNLNSRGGGVSALSDLCRRFGSLNLPMKGALLDIGCGNGEFLTEFHKVYPNWMLYGTDVGSFQEEVESRQGVQKYFASLGAVRACSLKFDFITLNMVLSLADNADDILSLIRHSLTDTGVAFLWEKDSAKLPFMTYCACQRMLFHRKYIEKLLSHFGFRIVTDIFEDTENSVGFVFCKDKLAGISPLDMYDENKIFFSKVCDYLNSVTDVVSKKLSGSQNIGVFGTSNAGLWMMTLISDLCGNEKKNFFFIDEDGDIAGKEIYGWHTYLPSQFHKEGIIFMPFPYKLGKEIAARMEENKNLEECEFVFFEDLDMIN